MKNKFFIEKQVTTENSENLAYLTGFIIGDGNLGDGYIVRAVEENIEFIDNIYSELFNKVFGVKPKIYFDKFNNSYVAYIHCKNIWEYLSDIVGIETRTKSRTVITPVMVEKGNTKQKIAFISGIFDAEGSVILMKDSHHKKGYLRIQLKMCSKLLVKQISYMLSFFGIGNRLYQYHNFSMIQINGRNQCKIFYDIIGFKHPIKNKKLKALL